MEITIDTIKQLKPHLEVTDVSEWSKEEWLAYRLTGIGASEVGAMLDMNEYLEPIILYNQKTKRVRSGTEDNEIMFSGRFFEDKVVDLWEYYDIEDGSWESTAYNFEVKQQKLRRAYKPKIYVRNPKYPWIFGGMDGLFWHGDDIAVLEIKTISSMSAKKYKGGIPTSYIFQVHAYMMLFEVEYCELAMLEDGRFFKVIPIDKDERVVKLIEEGGEKFWNDVQKGLQLLELINVSPEDSDERQLLEMQYRALEPEIKAKNDRKFNEFLVERFQADPEKEIEPTKLISLYTKRHESWKAKKKLADEKMKLYSGHIKYYMGEKCKMETPMYNVTYYPDKNNRRSLRVNQINHD